MKAWLVEVERTVVTEAYVLAVSEAAAHEEMRSLLDGATGFFWDERYAAMRADEVDPADHPNQVFWTGGERGRDVTSAEAAALIAPDPEVVRLAPTPGQIDIFGGVVS